MKPTWSTREFCVGDLMPPIFHLLALGVCVGGNANFGVLVGGNADFRYQHVGIPNTKLWRCGSKPMQGTNANGFTSQWNIGFTFIPVSLLLFIFFFILWEIIRYIFKFPFLRRVPLHLHFIPEWLIRNNWQVYMI